MTTGFDYELGRQIAALIARQGGSGFPPGTLIGQVQDLLGQDTTLLGPLRDLLQRPGFRRLFADGQRSVQIGSREALLQDLASLYHPSVVARLTTVVDGCLGLAPSSTAKAAPPPPSPQSTSPPPPENAATPPPSYGAPPPSAYPPPPAYVPVPVPGPNAGTNPVTLMLTVVASFLAGAVLLSLGWLMLNARPTPAPTAAGGTRAPAAPRPTPAPAPSPAPAPEPTPKGTTSTSQPEGAWGDASAYKFGQLPGGDYPNSCAFSATDSSGRTTASNKANLEYWACRDVGGDPQTGYRVVWADGKETTYTFGPDGQGQVVGTNGATYPMRWSNDSHKGENIVVINHQDGAITWIPGNITPSGD